ncbi:MAG: hypothetical protein M1837_006853 [Sclerophora amabilis]|nr:MAG: hypothetical protein M1837_006853 [Sclerophora amabilis]
MNFAKGILESRKVTYKHLKNVVRTIPLETPTEIELRPGRALRVTLFDANHCTGAVMFLIQGDGKAILYTGDIRAEPWWVNALVRNPVMVPYTLGTKTLDVIYLDTSFVTCSHPYKTLPSKAEGLNELLRQVQRYPEDTVYRFNAWTFGYEDVWIALSSALGTQVHVDDYKLKLYYSLGGGGGGALDRERPWLCREAFALGGFKLGNSLQPGILTKDQNARVHSCERGTCCTVNTRENVVDITPAITRLDDGTYLPELGAGGGDLAQVHELELNDADAVIRLTKLCASRAPNDAALSKVMALIFDARATDYQALQIQEWGAESDGDEKPLDELADVLLKLSGTSTIESAVEHLGQSVHLVEQGKLTTGNARPRKLVFPYSRHSSYAELCHLVEAFKPRDVYPCTVDEENWCQAASIKTLFGKYCSGVVFSHDLEMEAKQTSMGNGKRALEDEGDEVQSPSSQSTSSKGEDTPRSSAEHSRAPPPTGPDHDDINTTSFQEQDRLCSERVDGLGSSKAVSLCGLGLESQRRRAEEIRAALDCSSSPGKKARTSVSSDSRLADETQEPPSNGSVIDHAVEGTKLVSSNAALPVEVEEDRLNNAANASSPLPASDQRRGANKREEEEKDHDVRKSRHSPPRTSRREEAYQSCLGLTELTWAELSPVSSGNNHAEAELVL